MSRVRFEPTIPASKRAKTVHALDHSATVTGNQPICYMIISRERACGNCVNNGLILGNVNVFYDNDAIITTDLSSGPLVTTA
jgi:hypothetical protein